MYLIHYRLITSLTPVCTHVSNSISTYYLSYTCVCTCIYFAQSMLSVQHQCVSMFPIHCILPLCVHVSNSISTWYICCSCLSVCVHVYTCISIIKSVHILYLCVYMHIITIQSEYNVFAAPVFRLTLSVNHMHIDLSLNQYTCTHHDMHIYH